MIRTHTRAPRTRPDVVISDHWTGREALLIAAVIDRLHRAIWDRHGYAMGQALEEHFAADGRQLELPISDRNSNPRLPF